VVVYNRTGEKADAWVRPRRQERPDPRGSRRRMRRGLLLCRRRCRSRRGDAGRAWRVCGDARRRLFIDHTTVSAEIARRLATEGAERKLLVVDAPVSGGQAGAENGTLSIMCGGTREAMARARPLMDGLCRAHRPCRRSRRRAADQDGQPDRDRRRNPGRGRGAALRPGGGARYRQGVRGGFGGAAASWQMQQSLGDDGRRRVSTSASRSTGCARIWGSRSQEARTNGATLPVAALVDQFYAEVQQMGGARQDTSSIIRRLGR
jgi:3-hydroxyisobutyrate dehydrogenase